VASLLVALRDHFDRRTRCLTGASALHGLSDTSVAAVSLILHLVAAGPVWPRETLSIICEAGGGGPGWTAVRIWCR
jgi:hypothetical protein